MKNIKKIVAAAATLIMGVWAGNTANAANAAADTIAEYGGDYAVMNRWPVTQRDVGGTLLFSDSPEYVKGTFVCCIIISTTPMRQKK